MTYDIKNKIALVTGANRGIGKAIVDAFVAHGAAKVYAAVRSPDSARPLVEQYGDKIVPIPLDLVDPATIAAAARTAKDVQVVVNNAGVLKLSGPLEDGVIDSLDFQMKTNVHGLIHMAREFAPVLKSNGGGVFAQLNSLVSLKSFADFASYSASKAAAYSITQALREVLAPQRTLVISVHPGPIATDMGQEAGLGDVAEPPSLVADALIAAMKAGEFHVFPDSMARQMGGAYESFAKAIIEADLTEG